MTTTAPQARPAPVTGRRTWAASGTRASQAIAVSTPIAVRAATARLRTPDRAASSAATSATFPPTDASTTPTARWPDVCVRTRCRIALGSAGRRTSAGSAAVEAFFAMIESGRVFALTRELEAALAAEELEALRAAGWLRPADPVPTVPCDDAKRRCFRLVREADADASAALPVRRRVQGRTVEGRQVRGDVARREGRSRRRSSPPTTSFAVCARSTPRAAARCPSRRRSRAPSACWWGCRRRRRASATSSCSRGRRRC